MLTLNFVGPMAQTGEIKHELLRYN
jgi:hypothetical protein